MKRLFANSHDKEIISAYRDQELTKLQFYNWHLRQFGTIFLVVDLSVNNVPERGIVSQDIDEIFFCEVINPLLDESVSRHAAVFALLTVALAEKIPTKLENRRFESRYLGAPLSSFKLIPPRN